MLKLPKANAYSARSRYWEHLRMEREDDPEARIRELERPLADTARASEVGGAQAPSRYPYPLGAPLSPTIRTSSNRADRERDGYTINSR
jgi:hypothetical protein